MTTPRPRREALPTHFEAAKATTPTKPQAYGPLLVFSLYADDGKGTRRNLIKGFSMEMLFDVKDNLPPAVAARLIELRN